MAYDYKKAFPDLYLPKTRPSTIQVPSMNFFMVDGKGDPNSGEFQDAVSLLYGLCFTIKMSPKKNEAPKGYFEYVVPPLEGLWWIEGGKGFSFYERENWRWTLMIRQPEFVDSEVYQWTLEVLKFKKPEKDWSQTRFEAYDEGLCVQMMHIGPYATEPETVAKMEAYASEQGLVSTITGSGKHHEIYLSDPRKANPKTMKTVLRQPVEKAEA